MESTCCTLLAGVTCSDLPDAKPGLYALELLVTYIHYQYLCCSWGQQGSTDIQYQKLKALAD